MSIHSSFRSSKWKPFRSVHKRRERVSKLIKELKFLRTVYGLPKEILRKLEYKIKKGKTEKKEIISLYSAEGTTKKKKISHDDKETSRR